MKKNPESSEIREKEFKKNDILEHEAFAKCKFIFGTALGGIFALLILLLALLVIAVLVGEFINVFKSISGVILSNGVSRFLAVAFLFVLTTSFFAGVGSLACFSAARGFLLKNSSLSWRQKEKIEVWASLVGALGPLVLFLWIGVKALLEGKI